LKISRELKVGLIAAFTLAALYWGFHYLKGSNLFDDKRYFYAVYSQVDGLTPSRPVNINGFKVGQVVDISFMPNASGSLVVKMSLTNNFKIPKDSRARIYSSNIMGEKAIELDLGRSNQNIQNGDTLLSEIELSITEEVNQQVAPIKEKAEKLLGSIDTVMILASGFLNDNNKTNFTKTFESIRKSFATLEHSVNLFDKTLDESQEGLTSTVDNLASLTKTFKENEEEFDNIINNFSSVSDSLAQVNLKQTFVTLESTLMETQAVIEKINSGEGSLGALVNDREVYDNLEKSTEQLNKLLLDLKYNPKRYLNFSVFGRNKKYSEEEIEELEAEIEDRKEN
jgi:phospholipid/cholesterol/gamma-HCH transport system substrate-binding protein